MYRTSLRTWIPAFIDDATKSIKKSEHPKRELGTVGDVPVVGKDVGILYTSNLLEVLTSPANLKGILGIHLEVALCLAVFHPMRL